eukprot:XP_003728542.1 PREDICTED: uncharacterized protein LOC100889205 [Strongylocentrotus purpuratus]
MFCLLLSLIGTLLVSMPGALAGQYVELGSIPADYAAFSSVHHNSNPDLYDLSLSTFNPTPLSTDVVYVIRDIGGQLASRGANNLEKEILVDGLLWPNEVEPVPEDVFGKDMYWWVANGFLVPTKQAGSVGLIEAHQDTSADPAPYHDLTSGSTSENWWYHRVYFVDVDGDGRKDILTARADTSDMSNVLAEMVYFKQPSRNAITSQWAVEPLFEGPDALFRYEELEMSSSVTRHAIFSCQYFAEKLVVSWSDASGSTGPDFKNMESRVIEAITDYRYFDAEIVDINGDGNLDLLVSINSMTNGQVVVYEMPDDWATGTWTRHLIAEGFKPHGRIVTEGMGSPGTTFTFRPNLKESASNKPQIMLTGDDDSTIYVFEAESDSNSNNWSYTQTAIFEAESGTVGAPSVRDVDGDDYVEVFVPAYSDGSLHVLTYTP